MEILAIVLLAIFILATTINSILTYKLTKVYNDYVRVVKTQNDYIKEFVMELIYDKSKKTDNEPDREPKERRHENSI